MLGHCRSMLGWRTRIPRVCHELIAQVQDAIRLFEPEIVVGTQGQAKLLTKSPCGLGNGISGQVIVVGVLIIQIEQFQRLAEFQLLVLILVK